MNVVKPGMKFRRIGAPFGASITGVIVTAEHRCYGGTWTVAELPNEWDLESPDTWEPVIETDLSSLSEDQVAAIQCVGPACVPCKELDRRAKAKTRPPQPWYVQHVFSYDQEIVGALTDVIVKAVRKAIEKCAEQCDEEGRSIHGDESEYRGSVKCRKRILALLGDK